MQAKDFGDSFFWGISSAAYQTEGAYKEDGKGPSVWDEFTERRGKIYKNQHARTACDFYHRYPEDIGLLKILGIRNFRFSISWPRVLPGGDGHINTKGLDFYNRLIDHCLEAGIEPWITLYHWDLPLALEKRGGWTNRDILGWFMDYVALVSSALGDRVKYWMVLNEPMVFTGAGYFLGIHAPGRRGMKNFLPAIHHSSLCQAEGARTLRENCPESSIGTTFSCSPIEPYRQTNRDLKAARRVDALLNRMFIEPVLGMGYPTRQLPALRRIEKYMHEGDEEKLKFDFDFYGLQNYTREVIRNSWSVPYIGAKLVCAKKRKVSTTLMNWEVYPEAIYQVLKLFHQRYKLKNIIITENGAAFPDVVSHSKVDDNARIKFFRDYLQQCLRAKNEGVPLQGYFVWTLSDNFEWAEGYRPTFGIVHVDIKSQKRTLKNSALWYSSFINGRS